MTDTRDSVKRYLFQLQSLETDLRREAIVALGQSADERAIEPLKHIAANDPVPELRVLAADAEQQVHDQLQREQNFIIPDSADTSDSLNAVATYDPLAAAMPGRIEPTEKDKRQAQQHINQALTFWSVGNREYAVYHLALAIQSNPLLVYERPILSLAADLMGAGDAPQQAIAVLLKRIGDEGIKPPPMKLVDVAVRRAGERAVVISIVLLFVIAVVFARLSGKPLTFTAILYSAPQALLGLVSLIVADLMTFVVAIWLGGVASIPRYLNGMLLCQLGISFLVAAAFMIAPIVRFSSVTLADGTISTQASLSTLSVVVGLWVCLFAQTFVVNRATHITPDRAGLAVVLGMAITLIVAVLFGILQNIRVG